MNPSGYVVCKRNGRFTSMHTLLMPAAPNDGVRYTIDHKNRIRHDNRLSNLRWATAAQQAANKVQKRTVHFELQGITGVQRRALKSGGASYSAHFAGKRLGTFATVAAASAARDKAAVASNLREFVILNGVIAGE